MVEPSSTKVDRDYDASDVVPVGSGFHDSTLRGQIENTKHTHSAYCGLPLAQPRGDQTCAHAHTKKNKGQLQSAEQSIFGGVSPD